LRLANPLIYSNKISGPRRSAAGGWMPARFIAENLWRNRDSRSDEGCYGTLKQGLWGGVQKSRLDASKT
jgi:hypothetical protein